VSFSATRRASDLRLGVGSILYSISVPASPSDLFFTITETLPWMLHRVQDTLLVWVDDEDRRTVPINATIFLISPSIERGKPEVAVVSFALAPRKVATTVCVSSRFDATLLHSQEYPPDAHRGFDVPSALVEACTPSRECSRIRSKPLFVELPSPDFSMPFNVATLVSTAMAFVLGTMLNVLARRPRQESQK
jgi:phosphatidylinositol glycan class T